MLTVKHIHTDGSEEIFEAESVKVIKGVSNFDDGIFLDWQQHEHGGCNWKHVIPYAQARSNDDAATPMVYVMNDIGATVSRYAL